MNIVPQSKGQLDGRPRALRRDIDGLESRIYYDVGWPVLFDGPRPEATFDPPAEQGAVADGVTGIFQRKRRGVAH